MGRLRSRPAPRRTLGEHFRRDGQPKIRFRSERAAHEYLRARAITASVYPCSFCGGYHHATLRYR